MSREELSRLIGEFSARGGSVLVTCEGAFTIDWTDTKLRQTARTMGRRGHEKRRKLGRWIVRKGLKHG